MRICTVGKQFRLYLALACLFVFDLNRYHVMASLAECIVWALSVRFISFEFV